MKISNCVQGIEFSPIRRFNPIAAKAEAEGVKVYKLNIGQPDIVTPECFAEAIRNYDEKVLAYEQSQGDYRLINAIQDYYKNYYGVEYQDDEIIITMGASEALSMAFTVMLNPGDEVLMPEPYYSNYTTFVATAGGKVAPIPTESKNGYNFANRELLESSLTPNTKAIVCINPSNPTGLTLTPEEMEIVADFAIEHDLWIIADEAYREFVYDDRKPISYSQIDKIANNVVVVDSVSKRFSACGARIGYVASKNKEFMTGILKIAQGRLCVSTIDQIGAAELFKMPYSYYEEMNKEYAARRDAAYEEISKIPGVICEKPGGAFYMMIDLPIEDAEDFLIFLLTEYRDNNETVMFAPAAGFYATPGRGKSEFRIAYVLNPDDIKRACSLIKTGLEAYQAKLAAK